MNSTIAIKNFSNGFCATVIPENPLKSISNLFNEDKIIENLNSIVNDMLGAITHMPKISTIPGISSVHKTVSLVSFSCVSCLVCYKGIKMLFSPSDIENYEGRALLGRMAYSMAFSTMSLKLIDIMIDLGNTMINILIKNNTLSTLIPKIKGSGLLVAILLLLVELFVSIKILIEFWMRMAELVFSGVISPAIFVLWINKEWAGFLRNWWRRIAILIFTQVAQVLLLIIYSKMINGLVLAANFNSICLAIATLFLIDKTPKVLSGFIDNSNNVHSAISTVKHVNSTIGKTKKFISKNILKH